MLAENLQYTTDYNNRNENYIALVSELMAIRARGNVPLAYVRTYGCQQNVADSERIKGLLSQMGYEFTDTPDNADFILFNTCAVREHAEDRVFGNVGALKALKRKHPSVLIALCGCMMEQQHIADKIYNSFPFVGLVFGTNYIHKLPEMLFNCLVNGKRIVKRGNNDTAIYEDIPIKRDGFFKAWLPIMYGCNNFCTYCIVPYVRGRERSRDPEYIIKEFKDLVAKGYKDITLLGQNVNSYGKNLSEDKKITFAQLLSELDKVEGDYFIRFMTSHPKDCSKELIDVIANSKHISSHLHLPFQSGSDRILKEMNRHYDRKKYMEIIDYAKANIKDLCLTSDIIVGFPGETYDDFKETLSLVSEVGFNSLFTFIYSKRAGTPAAEMDDPVSHDEKSKWFKELLSLQETISAKKCAEMVGKTYKVLVDGENGKGELTARTSGNVIVEFKGDENLIGNFAKVNITLAKNWILKGELVQ